MSDIKGIILDLDGVITDTAEFHFLGWKQMADEEGLDFTREDNEQLRGVSRRRSLELILGDKELSEEEMERLMEKKNSYYQEKIVSMDKDDLLPGARELIDDIKSNDLMVAVASASRNARTVLNNLDITDEFCAVSDGYSVKDPKPAPDLFIHTAEKMGLKREECAVIEDAESGVDAALEADMLAVGVGPEDRVGHAHLRYDTVEDIDIEEILAFSLE